MMIPENEVGAWAIKRFTVSEDAARFEAMRAMVKGNGRYVPAGTYTQLSRGGQVIMSDTPDELRDLSSFRRNATGRILINGLGLGCALSMALKKPDVTDVTVIEKSQDVINLVAPHLATDTRVTVICADALEWKPPQRARWDVAWHDIWDNICADNLVEMRRLHRKYGRRAGWQGSWCRAQCERYARDSRSWRY